MEPSDACRKLIQGFESCRLTAYPDPATGADPWTIGWGHAGPDVMPFMVISQLWADRLFMVDVDAAAAKLLRWIGDIPLRQNQFDALVSFVYNVKLKPGEECHLLDYVRDGDMAAAAAEFPRWDHAAGVVMPGLVKRRAAEQRMFLAATQVQLVTG